jgi:hypothetical protein
MGESSGPRVIWGEMSQPPDLSQRLARIYALALARASAGTGEVTGSPASVDRLNSGAQALSDDLTHGSFAEVQHG